MDQLAYKTFLSLWVRPRVLVAVALSAKSERGDRMAKALASISSLRTSSHLS